VNPFDLRLKAGAHTVIFIPNRERARGRALVLYQLAAGRRRRQQHRETTT